VEGALLCALASLLFFVASALRRSPGLTRPHAPPPLQGFVTGSLAAVAAGAVTHPIDLVKVRLQLVGAQGEATAVSRGLFGTAAHIVRTHGVLGLYSGISGSVLRQMTVIGSRLGVYDLLKQKATEGTPSRQLSFSASVACGLTAGAVSAAVCNPADLVLVRMQADGRLPKDQQRGYRHAGDALRRIAAEEGIPALWRGTGPTVARAMVVTAAQMSVYDAAKQQLLELKLPDTPATHGAASLLAGGAASVCSNPFDVVKTRLQNMARTPSGAWPYAGVLDCMATTARTEGLLALYKGLLATWSRQAPLNTVRFIALEQLRNIIG
jgi:solute carrier family 25 oxoglutarate transporter 11